MLFAHNATVVLRLIYQRQLQLREGNEVGRLCKMVDEEAGKTFVELMSDDRDRYSKSIACPSGSQVQV